MNIAKGECSVKDKREHKISSASCPFRDEVLLKLLRGFRTSSLHPGHVVSFDELLGSRVGQREALTGLVVEKGMFTQKEEEK